MQVVILAAGRGTRLGAAADSLPKCLLQVGGQPLIERHLSMLAEAGASPVLVVVGHGADLVRETVGNRAETILNPRYASTNSLYSLRLARDWIKGPVVVMNCDILFDPEILARLLRAGPDHLVYDSSSGRAPEHMKVEVRDGAVRAISKDLPGERSSGENVGMVYLGEASAREVLGKADEMVTAGEVNAFWVAALRAVADARPIRGLDTAGAAWVEIDTAYDLERARRDVWPLIEDRTGVRIRRRRRRLRLGLALALLVAVAAAAGFTIAALWTATWETLAADAVRSVNLSVNGVAQEWIEIAAGDVVETKMQGAQSVRIEIRCLLAPGSEERVPYVVEVLVDGKRDDWHKFGATPSKEIAHPGGVVCDRDRIGLEVPEGAHTVGVRLVAGQVKALLVRFRAKGNGD